MAGKPAIDIPIERARELFILVRKGKWHLQWRKTHGPARAGRRAGCLWKNGRSVVGIDNRQYLVYRVIWCLVTGQQLPHDKDLDHKNGDVTDNRFSNLRVVSNQENQENRRRVSRGNKSTGLLGAFATVNGKFFSSIQVRRTRYRLGTFATAEEAHVAYIKAKRTLHKHNTL